MARRSSVLFAIIVMFLLSAHQAQAQTTITFDKGQPMSPAGGKINGSGGYTLAAGYSYYAIEMYATLASGPGQGGYKLMTVDTGAKSFSGQITGLPAGDYNVFARITVTKMGSAALFFDTGITKVTVVAAPK